MEPLQCELASPLIGYFLWIFEFGELCKVKRHSMWNVSFCFMKVVRNVKKTLLLYDRALSDFHQ